MSLGTWCLLMLAISVYTASFFLPSFRLNPPRGPQKAEAWGGVPGHQAFRTALSRRLPSWLANVAFVSGVLLLASRRPRASAVAAALGIALALAAIPAGPVEGQLDRLTTGYWAWTTANAILLWAGVVDRNGRRQWRAAAS
jgi:hypothetical protein